LPWRVRGGRSPSPISRRTLAGAQRIEPRLPAGYRIYAIGDVHGRADLLATVFTRVDADLIARPNLQPIEVLLGDYIDRGSDSRQVIDMLIARRRQHNVILLKGNHEECALQFLDNPSVLSQWRSMGGLPTILSYGVVPAHTDDEKSQKAVASAFRDAMPESHHRLLQGLAVSFSCGDFFFVHAGVRPGIPLQKQSQHDLFWIRHDFLLYEGDFGKIIVHGHTPTREPEVRSNRINIDTGAYATGQLTCLVLEDDKMTFMS
jgi:serine/threonine protein phosphatase 1